MITCPICQTTLDQNAKVCSACGYRFQGGTTQQFKTVPLDHADVVEAIECDEHAIHDDLLYEVSDSQQGKKSTLTVQYGRQEGVVYELQGDREVVGRSPKCEIFLNDMTVSRSHATLERVADGWSIQDDGSFNGVWVNNANIDHVMLHDGDIIQIGCFVLKYAQE